MALKILLLLAAAAAVWYFTRPRPPDGSKAGKGGNVPDLTQCPKCGVYHAAADPCDCEKR